MNRGFVTLSSRLIFISDLQRTFCHNIRTRIFSNARAWLVFFQLLRHDWLINFCNQARFKNQSPIANFSKLTPCVFCNTLFPHDPQTAPSFASVYTFRTRDFRKQVFISLREKTFSISFQLVSSSPCQAWQSRPKLQTSNAIATQDMTCKRHAMALNWFSRIIGQLPCVATRNAFPLVLRACKSMRAGKGFKLTRKLSGKQIHACGRIVAEINVSWDRRAKNKGQVLALSTTRCEEALAMRGKVAQGIEPSATL